MRVKVSFRFNRTTGEVELFQIDHDGARQSVTEHDRQHEEIAAEIGRVIARNPVIDELLPGGGVSLDDETVRETPAQDDSEKQQSRQRDMHGA